MTREMPAPLKRWKSLGRMNVEGRRVLTRLDLNVPIQNGQISDVTRIRAAADTVSDIRSRGGMAILMSHLGRPNGQHSEALSLRQLVPALEETFSCTVDFCPQATGRLAAEMTSRYSEGKVALLENLRFDPGETSNDPELSSALAQLGDIYCNDAFSVSHRAHASTVGVAGHLPSCAGRQLSRELESLDSALETPNRPVMAIIGGSKVSTKLNLLNSLMQKVDVLAIGGAMANTFLLAEGIRVGKSLVETDLVADARRILDSAAGQNCNVLLPQDIVVSRELKPGAAAKTVNRDSCPDDSLILDAGGRTVRQIADRMADCRTLVWNGPVGAFETEPFDSATMSIAGAAANLTRRGTLTSVVGGGDTVAALNRSGTFNSFTFVSTAGGAFLQWMEGRGLPGLTALSDAAHSEL